MHKSKMTLSEALDYVYGEGVNWSNPIRPYFVSNISQTPYEAFKDLKPQYKNVIVNMTGHYPKIDEI